MMAMMSLATLVIATLLATGVAVLLDWVMLRVAFRLMQPARQVSTPPRQAVARRPAPREQGELVRGTVQLARAFSGQR